jgi:hypothetical protein
MYFNVYDVYYLQYSHQHVSASILAIFRVMFLLQEYKNVNVVVSLHFMIIMIIRIINVIKII